MPAPATSPMSATATTAGTHPHVTASASAAHVGVTAMRSPLRKARRRDSQRCCERYDGRSRQYRFEIEHVVTPCRIPIEHLLQNLNVAIRGKFPNARYGIVMIG